MKKYIIFAMLAFAAISSNNSINAYTFKVTNKSGKDLLVQVELLHDKKPYFEIINSDQTKEFGWVFGSGREGYCLNNIRCVELDDNFIAEAVKNNIPYNQTSKIYYEKCENSVIYGRNQRFSLADCEGEPYALLKFLESNEKYRKSVIMKENGKIIHGDFCGSYTFTIQSEGNDLVATYKKD